MRGMKHLLAPLALFTLLLSGMSAAATPDMELSFEDARAAQDADFHASASLFVRPGHVFTLALESSPTTGYSWQAEGAGNVARVESEFLAPAPPQEGAPRLCGAPGRQLFTITALKEGKVTICLHYCRPREKGKAPLYTIRVELHVAHDVQKIIGQDNTL